MGFWIDGVRSDSRSPSRHNSHSGSRPSYARASSSSFFGGLSGGGASSSRGWGSSNGHSSRARPRSGFVNRIRRFLRDIYEKFRRHPVRMFMLVIMPLLTSGVLVKLFGTLGLRLPAGLSNLMGGQGRMRQTTERFYARGGARDMGGGSSLPGMSGPGWGDTAGTVMGIAKAFL